MRRFIITSDKFSGSAELVFNTQGLLLMIDARKATMDTDTMQKFKRAAPVTIDQISTAFTAGTTVIEQDFEISLDDFKREYPYSRNYHLLAKRWEKMNKTDQVEAYFSAIEYRKYCNRNDWYKPKIADSWLANKEYKNDWRKM